MALYIPHSIFHLARLLYVRPENFGPYYVVVFGLKADFLFRDSEKHSGMAASREEYLGVSII